MTRLPAGVNSGAEPPDDVPDERIVRESLTEPERFAVLFDRYAPIVHGYLSRRVGALADDLLSEAFLLAFRGRASYDPARAPVKAWLFGIATNLVRRHARDEERRYRALGKLAGQTEPAEEFDVQAAGRADAAALRADLARVLGDLPAVERDVLLLWSYLQLSYVEIAAAVDVPVGTVRSRLHRARNTTRTQLGRWLTSEEETA